MAKKKQKQKEKKLTKRDRAALAESLKYRLVMGDKTVDKAAKNLGVELKLAQEIASEFYLMAYKY